MNPIDVLRELDQKLRAKGLPPMDAPTLKEVHQRLQQPEVMTALQSGQLTTDALVEQVGQAMQTMRGGRMGTGMVSQLQRGSMR